MHKVAVFFVCTNFMASYVKYNHGKKQWFTTVIFTNRNCYNANNNEEKIFFKIKNGGTKEHEKEHRAIKSITNVNEKNKGKGRI